MKISETTSVLGRLLTSRWQRVLLFVGLWTGIGFLSAIHWWYFPGGDYPYKWWHLVAVKLTVWYIWGLVTLLILYIAHRFPVTRPSRTRNILALLGFSILITGFYLTCYVFSIHYGITGRASLPLFWSTAFFVIKVHSTFYYLAFWATVALENAMMYYRRHHQQELHRSKLETELAQTRLKVLQSQLQPHFFFNTLNTISSMIVNNEKEEANEMIVRLSELVRFNFEYSGQNEVTLDRELHFNRLYLELMKYRFEDNLDFSIDADDAAGDAIVPTMILQPLVENAVKYSAAGDGGRGEVRIAAHLSDNHLCITVANNLANGQPASTGRGVGLQNTRERLRRLFGDTAELRFESNGHRAEVTLQLPTKTGGIDD